MLEVTDLRTVIEFPNATVPVVNGVSLHVNAGETLGIVGESGCGKSMTALSMLRLLPKVASIEAGTINFLGADISQIDERDLRRIRGNEIAMIFQEPMTSLNPLKTIGSQISEAIVLHLGLSPKEARNRSEEMLQLVGIPDASYRMDELPHMLSGGMRQRTMIAMALSCNPKVLLADEPTTALDVTIQAQIVDLISALQQQFGMATILISHDLGLMAERADRVLVMYAGKVVEEADVNSIFRQSCHPYSAGLLACIPKLNSSLSAQGGRQRLAEIRGSVPSLRDLQKGCAFAARCDFATERCREQVPALEEKLPGHRAACWNTDLVLASIS